MKFAAGISGRLEFFLRGSGRPYQGVYMLRSLYVMLDYHIAATDGVQGTVQDCLFDDESWIVHYLVAETATPRPFNSPTMR